MIEKYKKKIKAIYEPADWYEAVSNCKRTNPFKDFSFKSLEGNITKKKLTDEK